MSTPHPEAPAEGPDPADPASQPDQTEAPGESGDDAPDEDATLAVKPI